MAGIKRKHQETEEHDSEVEDPGMQEGQTAACESDDEVEYYRQAVGQEPDEGKYDPFIAVPVVELCSPLQMRQYRIELKPMINVMLFFPDMFPASKKRRDSSRPPRPFKKRTQSPGAENKHSSHSKSARRPGPGGPPRDRRGGDGERRGGKTFGERQGGKKFGDRGKHFEGKMGPGGKRFGGKKREDADKFGGKKRFDGGKKFGGKKTGDKTFKSNGQKGKPHPGFKKKGTGGGAKQSFKPRKGKS